MEQCTRCPHPQAAHTQHGCRFGGCHCDVSKFADERVPEPQPLAGIDKATWDDLHRVQLAWGLGGLLLGGALGMIVGSAL